MKSQGLGGRVGAGGRLWLHGKASIVIYTGVVLPVTAVLMYILKRCCHTADDDQQHILIKGDKFLIFWTCFVMLQYQAHPLRVFCGEPLHSSGMPAVAASLMQV